MHSVVMKLLVAVLLPLVGSAFVLPQAPNMRTRGRMFMTKQIGVGVIGAGRIGVVHLEALASWYVPHTPLTHSITQAASLGMC